MGKISKFMSSQLAKYDGRGFRGDLLMRWILGETKNNNNNNNGIKQQ